MTTKLNASYPIEDTSKSTQTNFNSSNPHSSKISQLIQPIFNKIKDLSSKHLGSAIYLLVNQEDVAVKKIAKIFAWIFGISPTILLGAYIYDHLADLYHQHFENYSRMEESQDEISEDRESPVSLPQDQSIIEHLPEYTIPKTLAAPRISSNADDDISDTTAQADVDSDLGEDESESVFEDKINANFSSTSSQAVPKIKIEDCPEEEMDLDFRNQEFRELTSLSDDDSIKIPTPVESLRSDDISNTTTDSLEDSFEHVESMTPELLKEMKNSPEMPSSNGGIVNRIIGIGKGIKAFMSNNPFTSNKPNVTSNAITSESESKEPSHTNFEILTPIIIDHKDTKIDTTAFSIYQIKKDLHRMKLVVNNKHCLNIQDLANQLDIIMNEDKTDILLNGNSIIPNILHCAHQGFFANATGAFTKHVMEQDPNKFPSQLLDREDLEDLILPSIYINWNPKSSEKPEIIGKFSFYIKSFIDFSRLPHVYTVQTKCSLDKEIISWKNIGELPPNLEASDSTKTTDAESDDEAFETLEGNSEDISNANYNWDIAFNHLLNKPDACLNSTVTSEYLKSLKTKYSTFVYEDRLMLPGSITTDEIVNSLNTLKNNNPTNQTIFLPFLVKGRTVDHAVVATINLADETIEYFDPKGQSSIWPTRAEKQSNKNVFDFLTELGQKFISPTFSKEKIIFNKKNIPQGFFDNINCGAFCLQFIEERITRSFNDIENDRAVDPKKLRLELADRLVKNTHSNSI